MLLRGLRGWRGLRVSEVWKFVECFGGGVESEDRIWMYSYTGVTIHR
jgi:hypothetical protein